MIESLPRREREVFEILCRLDEAAAGGVRGAMTGAPSDSAVSTLLSRLEAKCLVTHRTEGRTYIYAPAGTRTGSQPSSGFPGVTNFHTAPDLTGEPRERPASPSSATPVHLSGRPIHRPAGRRPAGR